MTRITADVAGGDTGTKDQYNNLRKEAEGSSRLLPTAQATPNTTLAVSDAVMVFADVIVTYAGGNSGAFSAPATNPRIDVLSMNSSGVLVITQGAEAGSPVAPAVPTGNIGICQVYNRVGQSSIKDASDGTNGYILKDIRPFLTKPPAPVMPSALTVIPKPTWGIGDSNSNIGTFDQTVVTSTIMRIAHVVVPFKIVANKVSFFPVSATVAGTFDISLYSEDGQTRLFSVVATVNVATAIITTAISAVEIPAGNYWIAINPNGTANASIRFYFTGSTGPFRSTTFSLTYSVTSEPVLQGTLAISADTPPATITPTAITVVDHCCLVFRLDT